jgi:TRAP-type C4-dicarboxylate transport system substrate-binding protein
MSKRNAVLAAVAFSVAAVCGIAAARAQVWDMPVRSAEHNYLTQNMRQFAKDVEQSTAGKLKLIVHPEDTLVKQPDVKRAVATGQVNIAEFLLSLHSNEAPIFGVDSVPFLTTDFKSNRRLADAARSAIADRLMRQKIRLLAIEPWTPQGLYAKKEVQSLADLKGLKFRAYNPITARMAELMGAQPVTIQQSELAQAFSTGVVQTMVTSAATGVDTQAWDYATHFYDVRAFISWNTVVVNEAAFQKLDAATQTNLLEAAKKAEDRAWKRAEEVASELLETLRKRGMTVKEPEPALKREMEEVGQKMVDEWTKAAGEQGREIVNAVKAGQ